MAGGQLVLLALVLVAVFVVGYITADLLGALHCERCHHVESQQPVPRVGESRS